MARVYEVGNESNFAECPGLVMDPEPTIQSVEILEGDVNNHNVVNDNLNQFVNLPKNNIYIDGAIIKNISQLGSNPKVKVKFDIAGVHKFNIILLPENTNQNYTAAEKLRNSDFSFTDSEIELTTDSNGEKILSGSELKLTAAGNDVFTVKAIDDNGVEVSSQGKITNKRMFYIVETKMNGLTSVTSSLNTVVNEFDKHGISLSILPAVTKPRMNNIGDDPAEKNQFVNNVISAYANSQGQNKGRYGIAVAYTENLAVKKTLTNIRNTINVNSSTQFVLIDIKESRTNKEFPLWYNIDNTNWFISGRINTSGSQINISPNDCTPIQATGKIRGYHSQLKINIQRYLPQILGSQNDSVIGIQLSVNVVERTRAGLALGNNNIVAICTTVFGHPITSSFQNHVAIHELGHKFKMACNGDIAKKLPDSIPKYYYQYGGHCYSGVNVPSGTTNYHTSTINRSANCVMYGRAKASRLLFCNDCAIALKKVSLLNGV